jgi:hypothetical protein
MNISQAVRIGSTALNARGNSLLGRTQAATAASCQVYRMKRRIVATRKMMPDC